MNEGGKIIHREYVPQTHSVVEFFVGGWKEHFKYWLADGTEHRSVKCYEVGTNFYKQNSK